MEAFGLELNVILMEIFLPFVLFYLILFVFLKRSKIFGNVSNAYYSLTALTISLISIFSLYSLGLTKVLPYIAASLIVFSFFALYVFGILKHSSKVVQREEKLESIKEELQRLVQSLNIEKDDKVRQKIKNEIKEKIKEIESLGEKIKKEIEKEDWYKKSKEIIK